MTRPLIQINDVVREMDDAEYAEWVSKADEREAAQASAQRAIRNQLLSKCDWTQVADAPVNRELWAPYRQQLRDVTQQPGFPHGIEWPLPPT